jgi:glycosyltransferase involved in cell wall biosynthesis
MDKSVKNLKFSVITVVYNGETEIEHTILSCINQTYPDLEYIVVDGASNDNTINIINSYKNRITKFLSEPDNGIYDAMNKAIDMVSGDWVLFMNCGDSFYDVNVLSNIAKEIDTIETNPEIIYGNTIYHFKNASLRVKPMPLNKIEREMVFCHQSTFVKASLIKSTKFDLTYKLAADYDMMFKFYMQKRSFQYIDTFISFFNQTDGDTLRNYKQSTKERFSIHKDSGTFKNRFLMFKSILRIQFGLSIKKIMPEKLNNLIFYRKYKNLYV